MKKKEKTAILKDSLYEMEFKQAIMDKEKKQKSKKWNIGAKII